MWRMIRELVVNEEGVETVEMVILLVVVIGIAVALRNQLYTWFTDLMGQAQDQTTKANSLNGLEAKPFGSGK